MELLARITPGVTHRLAEPPLAQITPRKGKIMKKLAKRIALTVSSVAVAGAAVLGAGGTASAAPRQT